MKRILVIAVLTVLLMSTVSMTAAAAEQNKVVTRPVFIEGGWTPDGHPLGPAVGTVTFNTETGAWTVKAYSPLLGGASTGFFTLRVSIAAPTTPGRFVDDGAEIAHVPALPDGATGKILQSGTLNPITGSSDLTAINTCIANGGVFTLYLDEN